jgi:hypothetical protein
MSERLAAFVLDLPLVTVIGFDTGPRAERVDHDQLSWVTATLAELPPAPHRIAIFHAPAFPVSEHIGSSLDVDPGARDALWTALEGLRVGLVVNGHEHLYARRTITRDHAIVQVITGGAGAALAPVLSADVSAAASVHHALRLLVSSDAIHGEAFEPTGAVIDRFDVSRSDAPALTVG